MKTLTEIFDFFLPRICPACKTKLNSDEKVVCNNCINKIKIAPKDVLQNEYKRKFENENIISGFNSLYVFEKDKELQYIIHALKYNQRFLVGKFLGEKLGEGIKDKINGWQIDYIVPIPLHHLKKAERGYNQSFYIAKGFGKILNIPVTNKFLKRNRFTETQTQMNSEERAANMRDAFSVKNTSKLNDKNILLVDDVITTGATTRECGRVLLRGGAKKVYAASVAIADYSN